MLQLGGFIPCGDLTPEVHRAVAGGYPIVQLSAIASRRAQFVRIYLT